MIISVEWRLPVLSGGIFLRRLCTVVGNKNGKNHFFDLLFFKNGLYFEISHTSGRLVQLARTLPSHGRGHRFESCSAHHPSLGAAELRMASHHFRPKGGNDECRHRTRRGRMSSLARSASEDGSEFSAINGVLMFYTYILRSLSHPAERYIGSTEDLKLRLIKHNKGDVPHTSKFIPWKVEAYFAFETQEKAAAFERYLKSGSGHAFARRHF